VVSRQVQEQLAHLSPVVQTLPPVRGPGRTEGRPALPRHRRPPPRRGAAGADHFQHRCRRPCKDRSLHHRRGHRVRADRGGSRPWMITFGGVWRSDERPVGAAGAVVAAGQESGPSADGDAAAVDRRHTVADQGRCAVARRAGAVRAVGPGLRPVPALAVRRHLEADLRTGAGRSRCRIRCTTPEKADQVRNRKKRGSRGGRPPKFDEADYKERHAVECGDQSPQAPPGCDYEMRQARRPIRGNRAGHSHQRVAVTTHTARSMHTS
jgi:hypothetical protein